MRKDFLDSLGDGITEDLAEPPDVIACDDYELIHSVAYPFFHDTRQRHEKIFDECSYHLNRFRWMEDRYFNFEADRYEIPLRHVANSCWEITDSIDEIRSAIKDKFQLENDFVIFPPNEESEHEYDEEEDDIAPESN